MENKIKPTKSYRIWFSQRNGSTLLCKGLEQTGLAGIPGEYFDIGPSNTLCKKHGVETYVDLRNRIWKSGCTANGVLGIKHSMLSERFDRIRNELCELRNIDSMEIVNDEQLLSDLFPNCKHIYLTRRNKVRQAVSWWKAIKDNVWHLESDQENFDKEEFYEDNYDFDALNHLYKEATLRECAIQEYFNNYQISPFTVVYEDFVQNYENTILKILEFLEIDTDDLIIDEMFYKKTANLYSEKWVQRFKNELQNKMGVEIW